MSCNCKGTPQVSTAGGGSDTGQNISDMQGSGLLNGFCFKCSVFWIIIVVLLFLMLTKSGKE